MNDNRKNIAHYRLEIDLLSRKLKVFENEVQTLRAQNKAYKDLLEAINKEKNKTKV